MEWFKALFEEERRKKKKEEEEEEEEEEETRARGAPHHAREKAHPWCHIMSIIIMLWANGLKPCLKKKKKKKKKIDRHELVLCHIMPEESPP